MTRVQQSSAILGPLVIIGGTLGVVAGVASSRVATCFLAIGLLAPLLLALREVRKNLLGGSALLAFSLGLILFFGSRLFLASPTRGLLSYAPMSEAEFLSAQRLGNVLLSVFGVAAAVGMTNTGRIRNRLQLLTFRPAPPRRAELSMCIGLTVLGVAGALMSVPPPVAPGLEVGASAPGHLLWQLTTPAPALLILRGRRTAALLMAIPICLVPVLGGRRQALLTPLIFLVLAWMASSLGSQTRIRLRHAIKTALVFAIVFAAVSAVSLARRADTVAAVYRGEEIGPFSVVVQDQVGTDLLYLALAREPRPRPLEFFERILTLPIPRTLWPGKPLSYDYEFRERHFPAFGGALPISLIGTSFLSFLWPGALLAGFLMGRLARYSAYLVIQPRPQAVLFGAAILLLALDMVRVGGLYREVLTFFLSCAAIKYLVPGRIRTLAHV